MYNKGVNVLPLHVYSSHSLLESALSVRDIAANARRNGFPYVALTDLGTMSAFPELDDLSPQVPAQPLFGMDLRLEGRLFTLFANDEEGYRNLLYLEHENSFRELSSSDLLAKSGGLTAVYTPDGPASLEGEANIRELAKLSMGFGRFYLGIPYSSTSTLLRDAIRSFALNRPYLTIAFPLFRYKKREDAIAIKILSAIKNGQTLSEKRLDGDEHFLSEEEANLYYSAEEIQASYSLAASISSFTFNIRRGSLPTFPVPEGFTPESYLRQQVNFGLAGKIPNYGEAYRKRLDKELDVIEKMGYASYFLIVADYVSYAKRHGILVGPGRGSAAGSLVAFALGIVKADPIEYGLMFERFLNPERVSMPDIDVDFADYRRDEVIAYLEAKYGGERVARILSLQPIRAKRALKDIGMVYGYPERHINLLSGTIADRRLTLRENYKTNQAFRSLVDQDPYYLEIVSLASKIEGVPRNRSLHAAGVIINDDPLPSCLPCHKEAEGEVAQFEMTHLEKQGFLKMDLLGLTNLTIIETNLSLLKNSRGIELSYDDIPFDDLEAIRLIKDGLTAGLFQLESAGMRKAIAQVSPDRFEDLVAILALFRPGPMRNIPLYAKRKKGLERPSYLCPELEPILSPTYGIIVYQEQIMLIAIELAGFSLAGADSFRRAISKKDALKMGALKQSFLDGCLKKGHSRKLSERLFRLIEEFADYGFAKSHSLCYAILASQMAYLKAHYPVEFYANMLSYLRLNDPGFGEYRAEMLHFGILFALPSIDRPSLYFLPEEGKRIRMPISLIAGLSKDLAQAIIEQRAKAPFASYFDFVKRLSPYGLDQVSLIRLIDAGALDCLGLPRVDLRLSASEALDYAALFKGGSLLESLDLPAPALKHGKTDKMADLVAERNAVGMMVSGSPLSGKEDIIKSRGLVGLSSLRGEFKTAGIIREVKSITTKKGKKMAFLQVYDQDAEQSFRLFEEAYSKAFPLLVKGAMVEIDGHEDHFLGHDDLIADVIKPL